MKRAIRSQILNSVSMDELEEYVFDSIVPCYCVECGDEVQDGEPDLDRTHDNCPSCGASGDNVKSILVIAGLM
ncbi:hypothetical protein KC887_02990 [Candidatus Kaiserbacteria bacterium]|nr:hypothetical protein [Candidatus Kaiserbacteria bacterium]